MLAIVSSEEEAKKALEITSGKCIFISTNLAIEFYLEKYIEKYKNPLYNLILKSRSLKFKEYIFSNFDIAYDFCNDKYLQYFRDRLGYFLAELERSLDLANEAIQKFKPKFLIIGALKNYPGSSVVDGTLKTNAFFLLAKEKKIPYRLIGTNEKSFSFKQSVGKKIQLLRYLNKQKIQGKCDLLILATPRHLIQMASLIDKIKNSGIDVRLLTYSVTMAFKKELDKNFSQYLEKEKLVDSKNKKGAKRIYEKVIKGKPWEKFNTAKYKKNPAVLNYIKWKIQDVLRNETSETFADILLAEMVLAKLKPKALLVTTDPDTKILPYIDKAKESGIKTICIQHGAFYGKDSPAIYPVSDFFIAWSKISKDWLKKTDYFKKVKILVGTSPFHNYQNLARRPIKSKRLTILYLATKNVFDKSLIAFYQRRLFGVLSETKLDFRLLVRTHPYQNTSNLKYLMENFNYEVSFANNCSLEESINKSDLVIYDNTTAGFDAMLLGKPTIYFNPYSGEDYFNVKSHKASFLVLNINDLELNLPNFIKERKQWKQYSKNGSLFAKKYLGVESPKSRIPDIINNILDQ